MNTKLAFVCSVALSAGLVAGCERDTPYDQDVFQPEQAEATGPASASTQNTVNAERDPEVGQRSASVSQASYPKEQKTVYFDINDDRINPQSKQELDELASRLSEADSEPRKISVTAMAPTEVSESSDMALDHKTEEEKMAAELANNRANNVKNYLQEQGVKSQDWEVTTVDSFVSSVNDRLEERVAVVVHIQ